MKPIDKSLVKKYYHLNKLRVLGKLNPEEQKQFMDICAILMDQLLVNNAEVMKRLKVSDINFYNLKMNQK